MQTLTGDREGKSFKRERDGARLSLQMSDVFSFMQHGDWHTLPELAARSGHPEASISARLRDLRKQQNGGHFIEREYAGDGLWRYRMVRT